MVIECDRLCTVYRVILLFLYGAWISVCSHTSYDGPVSCHVRVRLFLENRYGESNGAACPLACCPPPRRGRTRSSERTVKGASRYHPVGQCRNRTLVSC